MSNASSWPQASRRTIALGIRHTTLLLMAPNTCDPEASNAQLAAAAVSPDRQPGKCTVAFPGSLQRDSVFLHLR